MKKQKYNIVAVIPIKTNNERLPGKNTKLLGGTPLISYIQKSLIRSKYLEDIYVYCSNEMIKQYLLPSIIFLKRGEILDLPTSNFTQIFDAFIKEVDSDIYVYAHATAPFITSGIVDDCIERVVCGDYDSAFCAEKIQDYLWLDGKPLNFDANNLPRSQDLKPIYRETSGIYVFRKEVFTGLKRRIGEKPYIKEMSYKQSVDINTARDFELAEHFIQFEGEI